jgi:hypothetical protein
MSEFLKTAAARAREMWHGAFDQVAGLFRRGDTPTGDAALGTGERPWIKWVAGAAAFIALVYYPVGAALYHTIDDDLDLQPSPEYAVEGGSRAVAMVATMVAMQSEYWAANKPFWMPAAVLDNMPNYQQGIIEASARFAVELGDYLGRVRGSSAIDADVNLAAGFLKYDGTIWYWGQGNLIPMTTAETQYRNAVSALASYNVNVAAGKSTYDRRADNLINFLDRVAADLGSSSAQLDARIQESDAGFFDTKADDVFYNTKGKLYAYHMILREIGADFEKVIEEKQATGIWFNMIASLRAAAEMDPLIVANGASDSLLVPSHLSAMGFSLLRARTQIRELSDALLK